jgi:hypothetical protein
MAVRSIGLGHLSATSEPVGLPSLAVLANQRERRPSPGVQGGVGQTL